MKHILITGINSYIGTSFEKYLQNNPENYIVNKISMKDESWKEKDFSKYDVVFHVAGIAHVSTKKNMEDLYYKVNRDLTIEVAKKAKQESVKQFIFMSSIIIYGDSTCNKKVITKETIPNPSNFYGNSKLQAEQGIKPLNDHKFKIVIIRSPMVYGKGSKGNYPTLSKAAQKLPIFPDIDNERSLIHIDNLCEFIKLMIDNEEDGIYFPQNEEYVKISEMVRLIAEVHGKKILMTKTFNPIIKEMCPKFRIISKVFGNLVYENAMSDYDKANYQIKPFRETIELTEVVRGDE
jgi:nucleoside-diphosphate-sugar epimerase